jgi:enoyl-CoA hydratase/carnithine racemase
MINEQPTYVKTEINGHVFEIILNRAEKRNAMNLALMQQLENAIDEAEKHNLDEIRAVIVRGEGAGFSSGIDLLSFTEMPQAFGDNWQKNLFPMTATYQRILTKFERSKFPTIAVAHNYCLGMAFELALACDFRIASEDTQLGLLETRLGLIPDVGGTTRLVRLVGVGLAKELIMTGRQFNAQYAQQHGIINRITSPDNLMQQALELVDELALAAPLAVSYAKRVIDAISEVEHGLKHEAWAQSVLINSEDFVQGAQALLLKQKPEWKGQ